MSLRDIKQTQILSSIKIILKKRENAGQTGIEGSFIEIKFNKQDISESFAKIVGQNDSIKLTLD